MGAADQRLRAEDAAACRCVGSDRGRRRREGGGGEHDPGDERAGPRGSALDEEAEEELDQLVPELIPKLVRNLKAWRQTQRFHDRAVVQGGEGPSRPGQRIAWRAGACQSSRQRRRVRCAPSPCIRAEALGLEAGSFPCACVKPIDEPALHASRCRLTPFTPRPTGPPSGRTRRVPGRLGQERSSMEEAGRHRSRAVFHLDHRVPAQLGRSNSDHRVPISRQAAPVCARA